MQKRLLPQTQLMVSSVCLGAVNFGVPLSQAEAFALLDTFVEYGGNFVDTARVYAEWLPGGANSSESTIGAWLKRTGRRDSIIVATKGAHPHLQMMHIPRLSQAEIQADIEASLRYLQTDVIDLYWLHRDDESRPISDILESLNQQVTSGKIRYFGCSNWSLARIQEAITYAQDHHVSGFVANQPMWSLAEPNREAIADKTLVVMDEAHIAFHQKTQMPVIPYASQGRGYFQKREAGQLKAADVRIYENAINEARYERIQALSQAHQVNTEAIVLGYLMSQPFPVFPVIGASHLKQLTDSLKYVDLHLSAEILYLEHGTTA
jgi:aryl-alcohol dehydrogenase-like predicted oxidoreductase